MILDRNSTIDPDVRDAIISLSNSASTTFDLGETLKGLTKSYNDDILIKLASISVDEYRNVLKTTSGEELNAIISGGLTFGRVSNKSSDMEEIVRKIESALTEIGKESKLNAFRVLKYNIAAGIQDMKNQIEPTPVDD